MRPGIDERMALREKTLLHNARNIGRVLTKIEPGEGKALDGDEGLGVPDVVNGCGGGLD